MKRRGFGVSIYRDKKTKKRKGVHAKCKTSNHKHSKNYKKKYIGQGR